MKNKIVLSLFATATLSINAIAGQFTMSEADKKMYEELKENNPAEMDIEYGSEIIEDAVGGEEGLAKFFKVSEDDLPKFIASFPRYMKDIGMVVGLDQALQSAMHSNGQKPYKLTSEDMVSLMSYVKSLANDEKVNVDIKANKYMQASYELGKYMWWEKRGVRGLSCADCHESSPNGAAGMILRTQELPNVADKTANSMGTWPAYRMRKSKLVTLQQRFKQCMNNSLQGKIPEGSKEMIALEVYVANMNNGYEIQIPGIKR